MKKFMVYLLFTAIAATAFTNAVIAEEGMVSGRNGEAYYITGGIGEEEQLKLEEIQHKFNVRVTSSDKNGAYIGDTHIVVKDSFGQQVIESDAGPLFFVYLPNGNYIIEATIDGKTKKKKVKAANGKFTKVNFAW